MAPHSSCFRITRIQRRAKLSLTAHSGECTFASPSRDWQVVSIITVGEIAMILELGKVTEETKQLSPPIVQESSGAFGKVRQ
jgi:hypothetical protein